MQATAMQPRELGSTGLRVSPVWMGTGALGWTTDRYGYRVPVADADAAVRRALDSPITCIDTSNNYGDGESERRIGRVIREAGVPDGSMIVTKVDRHPDTNDFSGDQVRRSVLQSQERLGMERFPLLFLHDPEHISLESGLRPGGPLEAMIRLRDEGVATHIGVAGGPIEVLLAYLETGAFEAVITHNRYTLLDRSAERLLQAASRMGVAVVNAAAFGGGILAGRIPRAAQYAYVPASMAVLEAAAAMRAACADHSVPLAAAAIQFSMREPRIGATIVGMSSPEHVDAALEFAGWSIPDELWPILDALVPDRAYALDDIDQGGAGVKLPSMLLGAAYYHEYQATPDLQRDMELMQAAGFRVIRVGESVWSTWEPQDGRFELEWLEPVLDAAQARGIGVVLGTPTYAIPPWLQLLHPEIAAERHTGQPIPWGIRQEIDCTNPDYLRYAERVIRAVVGRYAGHPAITGYQLDNEPGQELPHNEHVFRRFVRELEAEHVDVASLNRAWGLTHWSHLLSSWDELWRPEGTLSPQYHLAWRRFQARLVNEFIAWQAEIVREYARPDQFVTTCIDFARPGVDDAALAKDLDISSGNIYLGMQDGLDEAAEGGLVWPPSGTWGVYYAADRAWATRQQSFLITETNATSIGGASINRPAYDGQWQQVGWGLIARGAASVQYWHWHTLHHGPETYWGGVLPHDERPGRVYGQIAQLGAAMGQAGGALGELMPDAEVGVLFSVPSKWALSFAPPLVRADGSPDPLSYERIVSAFYRGFFRAGAQMRLLHAEQELPDAAQLASELPVLIAAGYYVADDRVLDWLRTYAEAGGHLVLGPRTGYANTEAAARTERMPARLFDVAGAGYQEYSDLQAPVACEPTPESDLRLSDGAAATAWIDGLEVEGARVLARYRHPHFGRWAAVTTNAVGAGTITMVGTVPDATLGTDVARWVMGQAGIRPWLEPGPGIHATSARLADGRRVRFVHDWSWTPATFSVPVAVTDAVSGERFAAGSSVSLDAWSVRVLIEDAQAEGR